MIVEPPPVRAEDILLFMSMGLMKQSASKWELLQTAARQKKGTIAADIKKSVRNEDVCAGLRMRRGS